LPEIAMVDVIKKMLASNKADALEWLNAGEPGSLRNLGVMATTAESVAFVQRFYNLGAKRVLACNIREYPWGQNSGHLLVQLPMDKTARAKLFLADREHAKSLGFDGVDDSGQDYLFMMLD
jgi:hypothetical protein